jgi:dephospho-CoA kinase
LGEGEETMKSLKSSFIKLEPGFRLYNYDKPVVALTGGIATGKSTVTKLLEARGLKIIDADALVKGIYQKEETKGFIRTVFSVAWVNEEINFPKLRELVFQNPKVKEAVETFIYARLPQAFREAAEKITDQDFYLYDVPLLFERHMENKVDLKIVVYAPRSVQLARLIDRDGSKEEIGNKILEAQMDIEEKKEKADFVINNSGTLTELAAEVDQLLLQILN